MSRVVGIRMIPTCLKDIVAASVLVIGASVATSRSKFPFGIGGKTELLASIFV